MNDTFLRFFVDRISPMSCFRLSKWNRPGPRQNGPPLSLLRQTRRCLWSLMKIVWKLEGDLAINATHFANANRFLIIRISLTRHCANRRIFCYRIIWSVTSAVSCLINSLSEIVEWIWKFVCCSLFQVTRPVPVLAVKRTDQFVCAL